MSKIYLRELFPSSKPKPAQHRIITAARTEALINAGRCNKDAKHMQL